MAVTSRNEKFHTLHGDCVQSQREQLAEESSRGELISAGAGAVDFDECEFGFDPFEGLQDEEDPRARELNFCPDSGLNAALHE
eukprot:484739-Pyramimonas_sp.AAC.1